jgi:hypothetical protein
MGESYWGWRVLRWRDCDGSLVGLHRTGPDEIEVLVGSGIHQGKRGVWNRDVRVFGAPDWVWERVTSFWAGTIMAHGAIQAGEEDRQRLVALARDDVPVTAASHDQPLIFERAADGSTQLVEQQAGLVEMTAAMVAAWGWLIFPLPPNSKIPFGGSHGFKDALSSTDASRVRAHWQEWPDDNIGLATGQKGSPVVIDIDPRTDDASVEQAEALFGVDLSYTLTAHTPSGGVHLYFTDPLQDTEKAVRCVNSRQFKDHGGIEIKGASRHVVMPPSVYKSGVYAWANGSIDKGPAVLPPEVRAKALTASKHRVSTELKGDDPFAFEVPFDNILAAVVASQFNGRGRNNIVHEGATVLCAQTRDRGELRARLSRLREVAVATQLPEYEIDKAIRSAVSRLDDKAAEFLLALT